MQRTCSQCDNQSDASLNQEPLCKQHAEERLSQLRAEKRKLEQKEREKRERYDRLCEEFEVNSYGEIEHQLSVEGREDITEEDVQKVNEAESEFVAARHDHDRVRRQVEKLKNSLA